MYDDLHKNALRASNTYEGKYVSITGALGTIDASGEYVSLEDPTDELSTDTVLCNLKTNEQRDKIISVNAHDVITIKGLVTTVGETLGYAIDITDIELGIVDWVKLLGQKTDHITTVFKDATFKETTSEDRLNATVNKYSVNIFGSQVRCSLLEKEESPGVIVVIFNFDEPSWNTDRFAEMLYFYMDNLT